MWNPDMRHMQQQKQGWSAARVELTTLASKVTLPEPRWQLTVEQASGSARWSPSCKVAGHHAIAFCFARVSVTGWMGWVQVQCILCVGVVHRSEAAIDQGTLHAPRSGPTPVRT